MMAEQRRPTLTELQLAVRQNEQKEAPRGAPPSFLDAPALYLTYCGTP